MLIVILLTSSVSAFSFIDWFKDMFGSFSWLNKKYNDGKIDDGCKDGECVDSSNVSFEHLVRVSEDLKNILIENGYQVADGSYHFFKIEECKRIIEKWGTCWGSNPDSPYGMFLVPKGPGEPDSSVKLESTNRSPRWRMRPDEAIVLLGITPPEAKYFSYDLLLYSISTKRLKELTGRDYINPLDFIKDRFLIYVSYGAPLNDDLIKTSDPVSPFNSATVVIVTANKELDSKLRQLLNDKILPKHGINDDIVNTLSIPADTFKLGYEKNSDEFMMLNRVVHPKDMKQAQEYFENPPAIILRIVPQINTTITKFEWQQDLLKRETGTNEDYLADALETLTNAVLNKHQSNSRISRNWTYVMRWVHPLARGCLLLESGCTGGNPDQTYTFSPTTILTKDKDDFIIVLGVNHVRTGKAKYMSITIRNEKWQFNIDAIGEDKLKGTAEQYLAYIPEKHPGREMLVNNIDKFYAYKISRVCNNETNCYEVPENSLFYEDSNGNFVECEGIEKGILGINIDDDVRIVGRTYRDPQGTTGPSLQEMLPPKFVRFRPK